MALLKRDVPALHMMDMTRLQLCGLQSQIEVQKAVSLLKFKDCCDAQS